MNSFGMDIVRGEPHNIIYQFYNSYKIRAMKKIGLFACVLSASASLASCSDEAFQGEDRSAKESVNVSFSSLLAEQEDSQGGSDGVSALIFHKEGENQVRLLDSEDENWKQEEGNKYTMSRKLEIGTYHFAFAKGLKRVSSETKGNELNSCFLVDEGGNHKLTDFAAVHPSDENGLKDCDTPLFLDEDKSKVATEQDLGKISNTISFSTTLIHAQGRLDILFVDAKKGDSDELVPLEKGDPLGNIQSVTLNLKDVNSRCVLSTQACVTSLSYSPSISGKDFLPFDIDSYKKEFASGSGFPAEKFAGMTSDNSKLKSFYLFPTQNIVMSMTILYGNGYSRSEKCTVNIDRNKATVLKVWITNEYVGVNWDLDIIEQPLSFKDAPEGDEGFWN